MSIGSFDDTSLGGSDVLEDILGTTLAGGGAIAGMWGALASVAESSSGTGEIASSPTESSQEAGGLTPCLSEGGTLGTILWIGSTCSGGGVIYVIIAHDSRTPYSITEERATKIHGALHGEKMAKPKLPSLLASTAHGLESLKNFFKSSSPNMINERLDIAEQLLLGLVS